MTFMDLPAVPPELRNVSPYIQRADELFSKDPVMSYWCAYYAAQVGITLKPKAPASRTYLINLLDSLERMKAAIGDNDAIHDESAASAYVENFALKVFVMADNEDRRGEATRGTAKKFLAAANFLEILRTFDKSKSGVASPSPDSAEEKIRYAKWKAADIAKAFREGRKPAPGPAGSDPELAPAPTSPPTEPSSLTRTTPPPAAIADVPGPQQDGFFRQPPPPAHVPDELLAHSLPGASSVQSPAWSTAANPGTPGHPPDATASRNVRRPFVSDELEGQSDESITPVEEEESSRKEVRFTSSVAQGPSPLIGLTTLPPSVDSQETGLPKGFIPEKINPDPSAPPLEDFPPGFVPTAPIDESDGEGALRTMESPSPPPLSSPLKPAYFSTHAPPNTLSPGKKLPPALPSVPVAPPPVPFVPVAQAPMHPVAPVSHVPVLDTTATAVPVELTPQVLARAQKHCRFAISALDYEDADQARKELRTALRMLGG